MEPTIIEFKTPSGYIVHIKPELNWWEDREIQKFWASKMSADMKTKKEEGMVRGDHVYEAQEMAMRFLIVKVITPNGTFGQDVAFDLVKKMRKDDGAAVFNKVEELTKGHILLEDDKKKSKSNSSNSTEVEKEKSH